LKFEVSFKTKLTGAMDTESLMSGVWCFLAKQLIDELVITVLEVVAHNLRDVLSVC